MIRTLGIVGGTFDPIHYGHLRLAAEVKAALELSEVRLIPAGIPPHRPPPVASGADRLAMTELGCAEFTGLVADGREIRRPGPSYTVATLQAIHAEDVKRPLALIIGSDAISATEIRAALSLGASDRAQVRGLLPAAVLAYIDRNQLYRPPPDAPQQDSENRS